MKLFPTVLVRWDEPAAYSYALQKRFSPWKILFVLIFFVILFQQPRHISGGEGAAFVLFLLVMVVGPWIHSRWPKLLPLSGARVTLFDDRITRSSGRSGNTILLADMASCAYQRRHDAEVDYWLLRFERKKGGFSLFPGLLETAVADSQILEKVISLLREQNILTTQATDGVAHTN